MEAIISILAILIAGTALILQIKEFKKKKIPARFTGGIGKSSDDVNTGKFVSFIFNKEIGEIIYLDIFFENEEEYGI